MAEQFRLSTTLQRVELVGIGGTDKLFVSIGAALAENPTMPLTHLDASNNAYGGDQRAPAALAEDTDACVP